jgi:hypothetical protein
MFFKKTKEIPVNPEFGFAAVSYLVNNNRLPITSEMMEDLGQSEGLSSEALKSILNSKGNGSQALNLVPREWCLETIVSVLVRKHRRIDENTYKKLVNVVNELGLSFDFLDKSIKRSKLKLNA